MVSWNCFACGGRNIDNLHVDDLIGSLDSRERYLILDTRDAYKQVVLVSTAASAVCWSFPTCGVVAEWFKALA